jgi:hypothetical protein
VRKAYTSHEAYLPAGTRPSPLTQVQSVLSMEQRLGVISFLSLHGVWTLERSHHAPCEANPNRPPTPSASSSRHKHDVQEHIIPLVVFKSARRLCLVKGQRQNCGNLSAPNLSWCHNLSYSESRSPIYNVPCCCMGVEIHDGHSGPRKGARVRPTNIGNCCWSIPRAPTREMEGKKKKNTPKRALDKHSEWVLLAKYCTAITTTRGNAYV